MLTTTTAHDVARSLDSDDPALELEMHVKVGGGHDAPWHRLMLCTQRNAAKYTHGRLDLEGALTACEEPIQGYYSTREDHYEGVLCPQCFLPGELRTAARLQAEERARQQAELARWDQDRADAAERSRTEARERLRRFRGETEPITKPEPDDD